MTVLLAVVAGGALGAVLERGGFCFHSTWRGLLAAPPQTSLLRAYLVLLVVTTPLVQALVAAGVIDPFVPPLVWQATLVGGSIFGVGMVVAETCVTGMFYKLGHGMLGAVVALGAWFLGDLAVHRGPLRPLRDSLSESAITATDADGAEVAATVTSTLGLPGIVLVVLSGLAIVAYLRRSNAGGAGFEARGPLWGWLPLGIVSALVIVAAWLASRVHGSDYPFGTSGVPSQVWGRLVRGEDISWWIPVALISLAPGAFWAARRSGTLWIRGETWPRSAQLAAGGLLMGVGAGLAGGCNLGHSMVGVPLLSWGSLLATGAMIAGVVVAHRVRAALGG